MGLKKMILSLDLSFRGKAEVVCITLPKVPLKRKSSTKHELAAKEILGEDKTREFYNYFS